MTPRQKTPIGPRKPLPRLDRDRRMAMSMDQSFQNPSKCRIGVSSKTDRRLPDFLTEELSHGQKALELT